VLTDVWAYPAALVPERYRGLRLGWSDVWYRGSERGNPYAHHLSGLHPIVDLNRDLNRMELLEIEDDPQSAGPGARPEVMGEYLPKLIAAPLRDVRPLQVSQPGGVSFTLDGHLLSWQNWQLRLGFNYREGLVLHTLGIHDGSGVPVRDHHLREPVRDRPEAATSAGPRSPSASGVLVS
jgi:primary-amine oxidase